MIISLSTEKAFDDTQTHSKLSVLTASLEKKEASVTLLKVSA